MAKVMICDDAAFMRMMIKDILTKNGYEIAAEAENGQKAVEKYPEAKPDLVLMDITMPEMDGIEALKKIKALDPGAKIIMCSAMGQQAMVIEAGRIVFVPGQNRRLAVGGPLLIEGFHLFRSLREARPSGRRAIGG